MKPVAQPERFNNQPLAEMSMLEALRTPEQLMRLQSANPTWEMFEDAYTFLCEYYQKNGDVPPAGLLATRVSGWEPTPGSFEYWFEEYQRISLANKGHAIFHGALQGLYENPGQVMGEVVSKIQSMGHITETMAVAIDHDIWEQLEQYKRDVAEAEASGKKLRGMTTGLGVIDETNVGWQPSEMVGLISRPGIGKTWMLMRQAMIARKQGKRVLVISTEMPRAAIQWRYLVLMAGHSAKVISQRMIMERNPLMIDALQELAIYLNPEKQDMDKNVFVVDHALSIPEIQTQASFYAPDLILVDNMMQLKTVERHQQGYRIVQELSYGLRDIGLRTNAVVMVTHHTVNKGKGKKNDDDQARTDFTMPSVDDIADGDAFQRACSTIIALRSDKDHTNLRWYAVRKDRDRGGLDKRPPAALVWDVDKGLVIDALDCGLSRDKIIQKMRRHRVQLGV